MDGYDEDTMDGDGEREIKFRELQKTSRCDLTLFVAFTARTRAAREIEGDSDSRVIQARADFCVGDFSRGFGYLRARNTRTARRTNVYI